MAILQLLYWGLAFVLMLIIRVACTDNCLGRQYDGEAIPYNTKQYQTILGDTRRCDGEWGEGGGRPTLRDNHCLLLPPTTHPAVPIATIAVFICIRSFLIWGHSTPWLLTVQCSVHGTPTTLSWWWSDKYSSPPIQSVIHFVGIHRWPTPHHHLPVLVRWLDLYFF